MFVHLAPANKAAHIRRTGLKPRRRSWVRGVFDAPVLPNFDITYQWTRELKRWTTARTMVAVQLRIPDDELVLVGHYARPALEVPAAQAVKIVMEAGSRSAWLEVVVRCAKRPSEIH